MVIAGPGTGKTELLSMRAANILRSTDVLASNILCLTFTESGASAMRERLAQIIGADAYKVAIHTFHSFGTEVINQNGQFFYHGAHFRPADELSSYELLHAIFDELDYNNPLAVKMNGDYPYISDTLSTISELKKSGLTSDELLAILDANDQVIEKAEPLLSDAFATRISKATLLQLQPLVETIRQSGGEVALPTITPLSRVLADSLATAIAEAEETGSTKPITTWKSAWLKKNDAGNFALKSRDRQAKLRAVSYVYYQYLARMQEAELYDFDDMILRVVHAMEVFPELRFNLQEKYQYIMVDEFQDTNMAQMRILFDLTNNEVNEGRPNILVVGDDDQAIYSFQGADVGNISNFRDQFETTQLITLTDNYRSAPTVLTHAREVITQGTDRLENHITELNKTLTPHRSSEESDVQLVELPTLENERRWLVEHITTTIKNGATPSSIAVLARRHHEIVALLPHFSQAGIRVNYERRDNVLELDVIKLVVRISELLVALFEQRHKDADALLPELLAHPAFGIAPLELWRLSLRAKSNLQTWMEIMATTPELVPLHAWLIGQSQALAHTPLEQMIDAIIGHQGGHATNDLDASLTKPLQPETSRAINFSSTDLTPPERQRLAREGEETVDRDDEHAAIFISPLFNFFFSSDKLTEQPDEYLAYLEALRCIRGKLREYQPEETPTLRSFLEFIRLHNQLGSTITSVRAESKQRDDAINLMTAHKSKGLEFDHVYVIGAIDNAWGERVRSRSRLIGYPENLPLAPSGDSLDERLRLFFVAMTRAKKTLSISYSNSDDSGKNTLRASFLASDPWHAQVPHMQTTQENLVRAAELAWYQPIVHPISPSMRELLAPLLENYKLSVTHLNSFLDVSRGGPQTFLLNNLLRFPQAVSPSAGYGLAIHATLQRAHTHLAATRQLRPLEDILHDFEESLKDQHLADADFQMLLQKGSEALSHFLSEKYDTFTPSQKVELNFSNQGITIGQAKLKGILDLVDFTEDTIIITDYKTGKAARSWTGATDFEKIKLHKYRQQLMFYELLVRYSRDYHNYRVESGIIQFVEPTASGQIISLEASFSEEELERFSRLVQKVWSCITTLDLPEVSEFEPSYKGMLAFEASLLDEATE